MRCKKRQKMVNNYLFGVYLEVIMATNSSQFTCPSPSISASRIISSTSSSVSFSPRLVITCLSSAEEMYPLPSLSKTLKIFLLFGEGQQVSVLGNKTYRKASRISSSESVSFIFLAIIVKNSGKSMVPLPSASTSFIISMKKTVSPVSEDLGP